MTPPTGAGVASDVLTWALRAVVHDLSSAAAVFRMLEDEFTQDDSELVAEVGATFSDAAGRMTAKVVDLRALVTAPGPDGAVPLHEVATIVLRILGTAIGRAADLEPPALEPLTVRAEPGSSVARAVVAALYGVASEGGRIRGKLSVATMRRGDRGVLIVRGKGLSAPRLEEVAELAALLLAGQGDVSVVRGDGTCTLEMAFALAD